MTLTKELTDSEVMQLDVYLAYNMSEVIPNTEALDGFFAALACCPQFIPPSEYMYMLMQGDDEDGEVVIKNEAEAKLFIKLLNQHYDYVNQQLKKSMKGQLSLKGAYFPLLLQDDNGEFQGNDWANGFLAGTDLRRSIWANLFNNDEQAGSMVPIFTLAYENSDDPDMRPFEEPITFVQRREIAINCGAGVMIMYRHFWAQRDQYRVSRHTFVRYGPKKSSNYLCPCGSGKAFQKCCGVNPVLN